MNLSIGAAVFVKTPGVSPIKTRLAKGIGDNQALEFYRLSSKAVFETLSHATVVSEVFWATDEKNSGYWEPSIPQGLGGLGDRMSHVYDQLLKKHDAAFLLGADSPNILEKHLNMASDLLMKNDYVAGPTSDGGFYLFAGKKTIRKETWTSVKYSTETTLRDLNKALNNQIVLSENLFDIDYEDDLIKCQKHLEENKDCLSKTQRELLSWLPSHDR